MQAPPPRPAPPWAEGCPWSGFAPPDIRHCEENVCGWVAAPANSWSNLAYVAAGLFLMYGGRRSAEARWLGGCAVFIGAASFAFHASYTFLFQVFDYAAMFSFAWLWLALRLRKPPLPWTVLGTVGSTAALLALHAAGLALQPVFAAHVAALLGVELARFDPRLEYRWLLAALGCAGLGLAFWMLDYTRVWCAPSDHLRQGHAAWHLLTALAFPALARFLLTARPGFR